MIKKVLYFHYQRSERDGSFVHTREFEKAFRPLAAGQGMAFAVEAPPLVTPGEGGRGLLAGMRHWLARHYLRDFKILLEQWRKAGEEEAILRRERPDIVLTRFDDNTLSILWACRRLGIPAVLEINAPDRDEIAGEYHQLPYFIRLFSNHHALALADGAFTVSEEISAPIRARAEAGKLVWTIPNGVDIARFDPAYPSREIREKLNIAEDRVVFGFVGSFAPWHGLDLLVDAFTRLLREGQPVHLLLVGQANPQWQALLDRLKSPELQAHVSLAGFVAPADIPAYLAAMDVTVLPNAAYYCSPLKLFEYMAMAKPTVAAETAPVAATLAHEREGLLFPVGDLDGLTGCLRTLTVRPDFRRALGGGARQRMEREFTWEHNAARVLELLETVYRARSAA